MLNDLKHKSGIFYVRLVIFWLVNLLFVAAIFIIFNVNFKESPRLAAIAVGVLVSFPPFSFITLVQVANSLKETTIRENANKIVGKDFAYLGLSPYDDHPRFYYSRSTSSPKLYSTNNQVFNMDSWGKPNSLLKKALFYPSTIGKVNLNSNIRFFKERLVLDPTKLTSNQLSFLNQILKLEKIVIKNLKKEKVEQGYNFSKGLPLATYLLICSGHDNVIERALFFKKNEANPLKVFMVNNLADSYENIETFFDMPESWLVKMTESFTNNLEMEPSLV